MSVDESARKILNQIKELVEKSDDGIYGDKSKSLNDINTLLNSPSIQGVKFLLAPTANLQELAIDNGWGNEFNNLAGQLEKILGLS